MHTTHSRTCPECRAPWQESDLAAAKAVHSLAVAVKAFKSAKPEILRSIGEHNKENPVTSGPDIRTDPQSRKRQRQQDHCELATQGQAKGQAKVERGNSGATVPSRDPAKAAVVPPKVVPPGCGCCPMCNRVFSLRYLQSHVDSCLISTEATEPSTKGGDGQKGDGDGVVDLTEQPGVGLYKCKLHPPRESRSFPWHGTSQHTASTITNHICYSYTFVSRAVSSTAGSVLLSQTQVLFRTSFTVQKAHLLYTQIYVRSQCCTFSRKLYSSASPPLQREECWHGMHLSFSPRSASTSCNHACYMYAEDVSISIPHVPPKICFRLLKEKEARKKLQDLGLSALGDKNVCTLTTIR